MSRAKAVYRLFAQDKTKAGTKSAQGNFAKVDKAVAGLRIGLLAGTTAAIAFGAAVNKTAHSFDELAKQSKRLGFAVDQLDAWNYVAQLGGSSAESFAKSVRTLSRYMFDISVGAGEDARRAFEALNIEVQDSEGRLRDTTSVMLDAADAMQQMTSDEMKLATAQKLFGRSGAELIPILEQGGDAIREQLIEAQVLGTRYGEMTAKGEDVVDSQLRISRAARNVGDAIMVHALPGIASMTDWLAIHLVNALTQTDAEFRRFIAGLRIGDPAAAVRDIESEIVKLDQKIALTKEGMDDIGGNMVGISEFTEDRMRANSELQRTLDGLESEREYAEHQLGLSREQVALQERIANQQKLKREEMEKEREISISLSEDVPMPTFPLWIDPEADTTFEDIFFAPPSPDMHLGIQLLNDELDALTRKQELMGDVFDTVWGSATQGPEAMGKALLKLGATLAGEAIKKKMLGNVTKKRAGVETELASAKLWSTYGGIPFIGPGIASGLIATMLGEIKGAGHAIGAAAEGGYASGLTLVGERGPELVNFRTPGQVTPNHAIGSGGGPSIVVNIQGDLISDDTSKDNLARDIYERLGQMGTA